MGLIMRQAQHLLTIVTRGAGLYEFTGQVDAWLAGQAMIQGLLTLFVRHTSASLLIQENADPSVCRDLQDFFTRLVPEDSALYRHGAEGPDDMPAHIKSALTQSQLSVPITEGGLALGSWQGLYLFEHRSARRSREVMLHLIGN